MPSFLGFDHVGHTGKFHTSWGEFGGFKSPQALIYECAQMVALGSKCLVGDQLHPNGAINHDTYASIAPAYERIEKLEPYLKGARQIAEIAVLSAEHFHPVGGRNNLSDDGAVQMLLELKHLFDVVDSTARFEDYRLLILPDEIPVEGETGRAPCAPMSPAAARSSPHGIPVSIPAAPSRLTPASAAAGAGAVPAGLHDGEPRSRSGHDGSRPSWSTRRPTRSRRRARRFSAS